MANTTIIRVSCIDQKLKLMEAPVVASGGKNEVKVKFTFCEKWAGLRKTAVFYRDKYEPYYAVVDENDACIVPWEVCQERGKFTFGVFGTKSGDIVKTSVTLRYTVLEGAPSVLMQPDEFFPSDSGSESVVGTVSDRGKNPKRLMVSFMDDDCRAAVAGPDDVNSLEYLIDQKEIPYTLACAPGDIIDMKKTGFVTVDDLKRMVGKGVTVSCHAYKQYNMDEFNTEEAFRADLEAANELFNQWGIPVETMSYPQGVYVDDYMRTVKKFYRMGFTVNKGVNQIPYASYYMDRVGLFKNDENDDGTASLAEAKVWVDRLAKMESGWLIFMTHAWYKGFKPALLSELIDYIRSKGIEIVDIHEALNATGNIMEAGAVKKPFNDATETFTVVDSAGRLHTNSLHEYTNNTTQVTELQVGWRGEGNWYLHGTKGTLHSHKSDTNRRVSVDIPVSAGEMYRISCSSVWDGAAYAVLTESDGDGNRSVVDIRAGTPNTPYTILENHEITIPAGGAILRVSCNIAHQPEGYKIYKVEGVEVDAPTVDAPTLNDSNTIFYILPVGGENLGGVKNGGNVVINEDGTMTAPGSDAPGKDGVGITDITITEV